MNKTIEYVGLHSWAGQLGHGLTLIAFVCGIFAALLYFLSIARPQLVPDAQKTARRFYIVHAAAVIGMFLTLLFMLVSGYFEYEYVYHHTKIGIAKKYILAAFWEGQEGSTLLWLFWEAVIGLVLLRKAGTWEAPVLMVFALVQVFLTSMLLGLYVGGMHIGTNPFLMLHQHPEYMHLPFTSSPTYPQTIGKMARGLNPLLQNYWMVIHPPTLFLGFALVLVPFAYAIAGLITKRYHEWQAPALPWTYGGIAILGTGILMGGAWAYESLNFGGFWAWDPVENASLVPWLTLVGAAHVMLIYRIKGQSLYTTFFLCIVSFLLIVYSTFLTKSGVLQNTSVHAFTDNGLNEELAFFMGFFAWFAFSLLMVEKRMQLIYTGGVIFIAALFMMNMHAVSMLLFILFTLVMLVVSYNRFFPRLKEEEDLWSREFWMFIGAIVLLVSSFQIIFYTSSPIVNKMLKIGPIHSFFTWLSNTFSSSDGLRKIANGELAPGADAINFYNKWQIPFAVIICLLMALSQYFKYRKTNLREFGKKILWSFVLSILIAVPLAYVLYNADNFQHVARSQNVFDLRWSDAILLFTAIFAILANGDYWLRVLKGKVKAAGASVAHIGFGLILLGALIATSQERLISASPKGTMDLRMLDTSLRNDRNIALFENEPRRMGDWSVVYSGKERKVIDSVTYVFYHVDYYRNDESGKMVKDFTLSPMLQVNRVMGNALEPDTRHWLNQDLYTHVRTPDVNFQVADTAGYYEPDEFSTWLHKSIGLHNVVLTLDTFRADGDNRMYGFDPTDTVIFAQFSVMQMNKDLAVRDTIYAPILIKNLRLVPQIMESKKHGLKIEFADFSPMNQQAVFHIAENAKSVQNFIVLQASVFPFINVLWLGCVVMVIGTVMAIRQRLRANRQKTASPDQTAPAESESIS